MAVFSRVIIIVCCVVVLTTCAGQQRQGAVASPVALPDVEPIEIAGPQEGFALALAAFTAGDFTRARLVAQQVVEQFPNNPWQKRSLFLMGRAFIGLDMPFEAEAVMLRAAAEYPVLADYGLFLIADYFHTKARYAEAAKLYDRVIERYPRSLMAQRSSFLKAQALLAGKFHPQAAEAFRKFLRDNPRSDSAAEAGIGLGTALAAEGKFDEAVQVLREVCVKYPGPATDGPLRALFADLSARGVEIPEPSPTQLYERGKNLMKAKEYEAALGAFTQLLEMTPDFPNRPDAVVQSGIALLNLGRRPEGNALLEQALRDHPGHPSGAEALRWLGRSYSRQGRRDDAIAALLRIVDSYPDSTWADDALYLVGSLHRESNNVKAALEYYERLIRERPKSRYADSAWWWKAWASYRSGEYAAADRFLRALIANHPRSFLIPQARYWRGRIAEQQGALDLAVSQYRLVERTAPYTYYGYRSSERLEAMKTSGAGPIAEAEVMPADEVTEVPDADAETAELQDDAGPPVWTEEAVRALSADPSYEKTLELMRQAMKKEAAAELWSLKERVPKKHGALLGVSKAFFELGDYHRSLLLVLQNYLRHLDGPARETPPDFWFLAYPRGYWDSIVTHSRAHGIDPFFVAAIIHAESHFNADALSPAGARGVMQVMPATGAWAAQMIRMQGFDDKRLYDPETSIRIGTWYLSYLLKRFRNDQLLAAAAYNAGPDAVAGWLNKHGNGVERDVFVESIPYAETRGYVKKVMRNYAEYRRIYARPGDEKARSRPVLLPGPPALGAAEAERL